MAQVARSLQRSPQQLKGFIHSISLCPPVKDRSRDGSLSAIDLLDPWLPAKSQCGPRARASSGDPFWVDTLSDDPTTKSSRKLSLAHSHKLSYSIPVLRLRDQVSDILGITGTSRNSS